MSSADSDLSAEGEVIWVTLVKVWIQLIVKNPILTSEFKSKFIITI